MSHDPGDGARVVKCPVCRDEVVSHAGIIDLHDTRGWPEYCPGSKHPITTEASVAEVPAASCGAKTVVPTTEGGTAASSRSARSTSMAETPYVADGKRPSALDRVAVAAVLREHRRTTGMAPAMGDTCRCGAWLDGSTQWKDDPRWANDLAQHQADEIIKALQNGPYQGDEQ